MKATAGDSVNEKPPVCAFGTPWLDHFDPPIGSGVGCAACDAEIARLEDAFAAGVARGDWDEAGYTPKERKRRV
jgi:hypothetical protein